MFEPFAKNDWEKQKEQEIREQKARDERLIKRDVWGEVIPTKPSDDDEDVWGENETKSSNPNDLYGMRPEPKKPVSNSAWMIGKKPQEDEEDVWGEKIKAKQPAVSSTAPNAAAKPPLDESIVQVMNSEGANKIRDNVVKNFITDRTTSGAVRSPYTKTATVEQTELVKSIMNASASPEAKAALMRMLGSGGASGINAGMAKYLSSMTSKEEEEDIWGEKTETDSTGNNSAKNKQKEIVWIPNGTSSSDGNRSKEDDKPTSERGKAVVTARETEKLYGLSDMLDKYKADRELSNAQKKEAFVNKVNIIGEEYGAVPDENGNYSLLSAVRAYTEQTGSGTFHIGGQIAGSFGAWGGTASVQLVIDGKGNIVGQGTVGAGAGISSGSFSVGAFAGGTNANAYNDLTGHSFLLGGSASAGIVGGGDVIQGIANIEDVMNLSETYSGGQGFIGTGTPGGEGHIYITYTETLKNNQGEEYRASVFDCPGVQGLINGIEWLMPR